MIYPQDDIRFNIEFNADRFRAQMTEILEQRTDALKAMVLKRCDELAKQLDDGWLEKQVQQKVDSLWGIELQRFIQNEAQSRVYEEMDKVRETLAKRAKRPRAIRPKDFLTKRLR